MNRLLTLVVLLVAGLLAACEAKDVVPGNDAKPADLEAPRSGLCRPLDVKAVAAPADDTEPVPCTQGHTAETFYVGSFDEAATEDAAYDDEELGEQVAKACRPRFK